MRARFQQQPEPAIAPIPAERPGRKTPPKAAPRPRVRQTRKKTSTPSPKTMGPTRKVSSKKINSNFDATKKKKRAPQDHHHRHSLHKTSTHTIPASK